MSAAAIQAAVERFTDAAARRIPCAPVRDVLGATDLASAYEVQQRQIAARVAAGQRIVGRKIGLTNLIVQAQLGVDQPDFGVLLADAACSETEAIDIGRLMQPKIEAEIAFVLHADLDGDQPIMAARVRDAVAYASPALEIVDSRIAGWDITIVDTVADNASSGLFVVGSTRTPLSEFDPVAVTMTMRRDGRTVSVGTGADCLGDPLAAVTWLAETVRGHGRPLQAGEIILSGALGPMAPVEPGAAFVAELCGLGDVRATFTLTSTVTSTVAQRAGMP
jgi:2-keto-4-pentenoate hydratase